MTDVKIGDRVGWNETYLSEANVLQNRTVWGTVVRLFHDSGDMGGFSINGEYAEISALDGSTIYLLTSDIQTIAQV